MKPTIKCSSCGAYTPFLPEGIDVGTLFDNIAVASARTEQSLVKAARAGEDQSITIAALFLRTPEGDRLVDYVPEYGDAYGAKEMLSDKSEYASHIRPGESLVVKVLLLGEVTAGWREVG
jgi:hypothetical protein